MAVTIGKKPSKTRIKLADLLSEQGFVVDAEAVQRNYPYYSSPQFDGCSWYADGYRPEQPSLNVHFYSYSTMLCCIRRGIELAEDGSQFWYEVSPKAGA